MIFLDAFEKYGELALELSSRGYKVFYTGTEQEGEGIRPFIPVNQNIIDLTGKLDLEQLILFISRVDALVACSTGPLHIAGVTGIFAIGLFSPRRPIHPGRWMPIGPNTCTLVHDQDCPDCKKKKQCGCISQITVEKVLREIG